jgi:hypothetical protein
MDYQKWEYCQIITDSYEDEDEDDNEISYYVRIEYFDINGICIEENDKGLIEDEKYTNSENYIISNSAEEISGIIFKACICQLGLAGWEIFSGDKGGLKEFYKYLFKRPLISGRAVFEPKIDINIIIENYYNRQKE